MYIARLEPLMEKKYKPRIYFKKRLHPGKVNIKAHRSRCSNVPRPFCSDIGKIRSETASAIFFTQVPKAIKFFFFLISPYGTFCSPNIYDPCNF